MPATANVTQSFQIPQTPGQTHSQVFSWLFPHKGIFPDPRHGKEDAAKSSNVLRVPQVTGGA